METMVTKCWTMHLSKTLCKCLESKPTEADAHAHALCCGFRIEFIHMENLLSAEDVHVVTFNRSNLTSCFVRPRDRAIAWHCINIHLVSFGCYITVLTAAIMV